MVEVGEGHVGLEPAGTVSSVYRYVHGHEEMNM